MSVLFAVILVLVCAIVGSALSWAIARMVVDALHPQALGIVDVETSRHT
jgi:hypothetical protein